MVEQISALLRTRHRIQPGQDDDFSVRTLEEFATMLTSTTTTMTYLLASIAAVSLLVGGIGIMNIMLVSVTERTREIGIRMAIGAKGRHVLLQFLFEAITLSIVGGLIGILLGTLTGKKLLGWIPEEMFRRIVSALLVVLGVAILITRNGAPR